jgi:hypothetical protein
VSITDYVIDILLILFILRQVRPHELTLRTLVVLLALAGAALGLFSGLADKTWHDRRGRLVKIRPASRTARA